MYTCILKIGWYYGLSIYLFYFIVNVYYWGLYWNSGLEYIE